MGMTRTQRLWRGVQGQHQRHGICETMQVHKSRAVGVDLEHHAIAAGAAVLGRPIQCATRKNQPSFRTISVAVGKKTSDRIGFSRIKTMQEGERAVGIDREYCASAVGAAFIRRPIQGVAGQN